MKKFYLTLLALLAFGFCKAQFVTIPDANFVTWLNANGFSSCMNGNQLDTTCSVILNPTSLTVQGDIINFTGLQYFKNLDTLYVSSANQSPYGPYTNLGQLPSHLTYLDCENSGISTLSNLPSSLSYIDCFGNYIAFFNSLPSSLTYLNCNGNQRLKGFEALPEGLIELDFTGDSVNSLPAMPTSLVTLYCDVNILSSLPDLSGTSLQTLVCGSNFLTSLPNLPSTLKDLDCSYNNISVIPEISALLGSLYASHNIIDSIAPDNLFNPSIIDLSYNQLTTIPSTAGNSNLISLSLNNNHLTSIGSLPNYPFFPYNFYSINCKSNPNLSCLPVLPTLTQVLNIDSTDIKCVPNNPNNVSTLPLCINDNPNGCIAVIPDNYVYIPDLNFVNWLKANGFVTCMSGRYLDTLCSAVLNAKTVNCSSSFISDLTGIQYFKKLDTLNCFQNSLTTLPVLPETVQYLNCADNGIKSIPAFPASLVTLYASQNALTSLPALPSELITMECSQNKITSLPALPSTLQTLYCSLNNLTGLPSLHNSLTYLDCSSNQISAMPSLPLSIASLYCSGNQLTILPTLPPSLLNLDCSANQLTSLPVLPDSLAILFINNNTTLSCLPQINKILDFVFSSTNILCAPDYGTVHNSSPNFNSLPLCSASNPNGCSYASSSDNYVLIPDADFVTWLKANGYSSCMKADSMDTTCSKVVNAKSLLVDGNFTISNLYGIQFFKSLDSLTVEITEVTTMPAVGSSNITYYGFSGNHKAKNIVSLPPKVTSFYCTQNSVLNTLPALPSTITYIDCQQDSLTSLPALPAGLQYLDCSSIDLGSHNVLTSLPALPSTLYSLYCQGNELTSLPTLPSALVELVCFQNDLTSLPALPSNLQDLQCDANPNLACLPTLPSSLNELSFSATQIVCIPNNPNNAFNYPLCSNFPLEDSIVSSDTIICTGTPVKFKEYNNIGNAANYIWSKNSAPFEANVDSFTYSSFANGDIISCAIYGFLCGNYVTTNNHFITMQVADSYAPSVSISASPGAFIPPGAQVTFTAEPVYGGQNPTYQWKVNGTGAGANSRVFTVATLNNGDQVTCTMTSGLSCASPASVTSNTITMTVRVTYDNRVLIPDTAFVRWLDNHGFASCMLGQYMDTTCSAVLNATSIDCDGFTGGGGNISNLQGIQYFKDLDTLWCYANRLTGLPPLPGTLFYLDCSDNSISELPSIPSGMLYLFCDENFSITSLPPLPFGLQWLGCGLNAILTFPPLPNTLIYFECYQEQDGFSYLTSLPALPLGLTSLNCNDNNMDTLPPLPYTLQFLDVEYCAYLSSLPPLPDGLEDLNCGWCTSLYCLPTLPFSLLALNTDGSSIQCVPNNPNNASALPICSSALATVSITSSANNICPGTLVTFTANATEAGSTPTYQWTKNSNDVGTNDSVYSYNGLVNGDVISCTVTGSVCSYAQNAESNNITMTVNTPVIPLVTISSISDTICSGTSLTFTATPTNGGSASQYQWTKNSVDVGSNSVTYRDSSLVNGDVVGCTLTSNAACATPPTAHSNTITISVHDTITPAITISITSGTPICSGNRVTFTATPVNGGPAPLFQWTKNSHDVGVNSAVYNDSTLANGDVINCTLTSNAPCVTSNVAISNNINAIVNTTVVPALTISDDVGNTICNATPVRFTATPTNGGIVPVFQWTKNNIVAGSNSPIYKDSSLVNGDAIKCTMISSVTCASPTTATSNGITMTVNAIVVPSVGINSNSGTTICSGTSVTFTATPTNGGVTPNYQWKKNNVNVGTDSVAYSTNSLANGDVITCTLTSNATCVSPTIATSNGITLKVNATVVPTISINSNSGTTICSGTSITFTATPTNGGNTPTYQWKKNNVNDGVDSIAYSINTLANGDVITCMLTSNATCASPTTATSNSINMTVNAIVVPSVSINSNSGTTICNGTSVTFTATPTNGGVTPNYQWKKNNVNVGTDSVAYSSNTLAKGDVITCMLTSNATCVSPTIATSNGITLKVNATVVPTISINSNSGTTICSGTSVTFTATPTNGGDTPTYQWKKNNVNDGVDSIAYSINTLANGDVITCTLTSNATCASPTTATSNSITMTVNAIVVPSVSINSNSGTTICSGTSVTFTATPTNGGFTPNYQWKKNNVNVGTDSVAYSTNTLANGDVITCTLTSNAACASPTTANSNSITITVNSIPASPLAIAGSGATSSQITANWEVVMGATSYFLDLSDSNDFSSFVPGYKNYSVGNFLSVNLIGLTSATTYYYRIRATNSCGTGGNSNTVNYATVASGNCPPIAGGSISPDSSVICSGSTQLLTLNGATGGNFQWQVSANNITWNNVSSGGNGTTYITLPSDGTSLKYYRCLSSNNCFQVASNTAVVGISATPVIKITGVTATSVTISWTPYIPSQFNVSWLGAGTGSADSVASSSFTINGLTSNENLVISVNSVMPGCSGVNAGTATIRTLCGSPTITQLTAATAPVSGFKVTWSSVAGATAYRVYYRNVLTSSTWSFADTTNDTVKTIAVTGGGQTYAIYVAVKNCPSVGSIGQGSPIMYVTTNPPAGCSPIPVVSAVSNCQNQISVSITGGSGPYLLTLMRISPSLTSAVNYPVSSPTINITTGTQTNTSVWEVFVRTNCSSGSYSEASNIVMVTLNPSCPAVSNVVLSQPTCHGFTVTWNSSNCGAGVSGYDLFIKKSGTLNYSGYTEGLVNNTTVGWLSAQTTYNVEVISIGCNNIPSPVSATDTITLPACRENESDNDSAITSPVKSGESVIVYPNPTQREFFVDMGSTNLNDLPVKIELINPLGQVIETEINEMRGGHLSQLINVDEKRAGGIYFVRTSVGSHIYENKVMIAN